MYTSIDGPTLQVGNTTRVTRFLSRRDVFALFIAWGRGRERAGGGGGGVSCDKGALT